MQHSVRFDKQVKPNERSWFSRSCAYYRLLAASDTSLVTKLEILHLVEIPAIAAIAREKCSSIVALLAKLLQSGNIAAQSQLVTVLLQILVAASLSSDDTTVREFVAQNLELLATTCPSILQVRTKLERSNR